MNITIEQARTDLVYGLLDHAGHLPTDGPGLVDDFGNQGVAVKLIVEATGLATDAVLKAATGPRCTFHGWPAWCGGKTFRHAWGTTAVAVDALPLVLRGLDRAQLDNPYKRLQLAYLQALAGEVLRAMEEAKSMPVGA